MIFAYLIDGTADLMLSPRSAIRIPKRPDLTGALNRPDLPAPGTGPEFLVVYPIGWIIENPSRNYVTVVSFPEEKCQKS